MSKLLSLLAITVIGFLSVKADGDSRILGGSNAVNGQFPHHVQIRHVQYKPFRGPHCGGSIIGDRFVLTAAFCFNYPFNDTSQIRVHVGEVDLHADAIQHLVDKLIKHPVENGIQHNIAVVRVVQPFQFSANVRAIQLPTEDTSITDDGSELATLVVGWGQYTTDGQDDIEDYYPWILQWLNTSAISHAECRRFLGEDIDHRLNDGHICARPTASPDDGACGYDQGGGLIVDGAQPVIIGVLSWITNACVDHRLPQFYTRVFPLLPFILSAMENQE